MADPTELRLPNVTEVSRPCRGDRLWWGGHNSTVAGMQPALHKRDPGGAYFRSKRRSATSGLGNRGMTMYHTSDW